MTIKTFATLLFVGAIGVGKCAIVLHGASAVVGIAGNMIAASQQAPQKKPQQAPQYYHLQGFRGWERGYPVSYPGCSPTSILPVACIIAPPLKQPV